MKAEASDYKIVTVLNKNLEPGIALNTAAHMALGLTARAAKEKPDLFQAMHFLNYADKDGGDHMYISALSLIVLRANAHELRRLRGAFRDAGILHVDFTNQMTQGTYVEQLERSRNTPEVELEYYGLCACGTRSELDSLTRKFSLWR